MVADRPALAASIILVSRSPYRVLMVRRGAVGAFWHAHVFPGGRVDPGDHDDDWRPPLGSEGQDSDPVLIRSRIAAVRELYEETGIQLSRPGRVEPSVGELGAMAAENRGVIPLSDVHHVGHWITPPTRPRRFDTHFFLHVVPEPAPVHADGIEIVEAGWMEPHAVLRDAIRGDRSVMFPTAAHLAWLSEFDDADLLDDHARRRRVVTVAAEVHVDREGRELRTIPAEAGYPLHRWPPIQANLRGGPEGERAAERVD